MENLNAKYKVVSQTQSSILTRSFLVAGLSFLLICLIGLGFGKLFEYEIYEKGNLSVVNSLYMISILLIFISMFGSILVFRNLLNQKTSKIIFWIGLYCLAQGIGFGMLFSLFAQDSWTLILMFGVSGIMFILCAVIGYFMSANAAFNLMKMLSIGWIATFILMILMFIPMIFMLSTGASYAGFQWYYSLIMGVFCLLFMGYISYDVWMISKTSEFAQIADSRAFNNLSLFFGYRLLIDFVGLFWTITSLVLRFRR